MNRTTRRLVEKFRARGYSDECDASCNVFQKCVNDVLPARLAKEAGLESEEALTVMDLALTAISRRLTTDAALRLALRNGAAELIAGELERQDAWESGRLVRFRRKR